jgi:hypothetical protein
VRVRVRVDEERNAIARLRVLGGSKAARDL